MKSNKTPLATVKSARKGEKLVIKTACKVREVGVTNRQPRHSYIVSVGPRGGISCSCPAFHFQSTSGACKHIKKLLSEVNARTVKADPDIQLTKEGYAYFAKKLGRKAHGKRA